MAKKPKLKVVADADKPPPKEADKPEVIPPRDEELCGRVEIQERVRELAKDVSAGFRSQWDRGNDQLDFWDIYDCVLGGMQSYAGNAQIFVPIVNEAIEARATRFTNQIFPRSARNIECITSDEKPYDIMALLEHYIRKTKLRTQIVPALCRAGDVEGQYNIYVGWENAERHIAYKADPQTEIEGEQVPDIQDDEDDYDVEEETTQHMQPVVELLSDCDVLVLPHTANSIGAALAKGGSVTVIRRWSKSRLEDAIDDGEIDKEEGEALLEEFKDNKGEEGAPDADKKHVDAAGIHVIDGMKTAVLYETWTHLKITKDERRLCKILYAGGAKERIASVKRNPNWNDKCPVLSAPVKKMKNVFKGVSNVKRAAPLQYAANDAVNQGWDSATYSLMPIVMTDPSKNPRVGSMILNLAAIWETNPNDTKFAEFPPLWKDAFAMVASCKTEIFQLLSVSPAMIAQSSGQKAKRNQAEIAAEQQVDILSTADVCTNLEDEILTPLLRWFVELDYQHRDEDLTVRQYGQMGIRAKMEAIKPLQSDRRYEFRWFGVEAARNAQQVQLQVAAINVIKGVPPQQYQGYTLNLVPFIQQMIENSFGSRLAPEIFQDIKAKLTVAPEMENEFLVEGLTLPVHMLDDDQAHMQAHIEALKEGDPHGNIREHLMLHRFQMQQKMQMEQQSIQQMQGGQGGQPPGGGGQGGGPRSGSVGGQPRGGQQPPGAIHQDRMQGTQAPRR